MLPAATHQEWSTTAQTTAPWRAGIGLKFVASATPAPVTREPRVTTKRMQPRYREVSCSLGFTRTSPPEANVCTRR